MENKSLTDKIYQELMEGLKTGLDWTHFLAEYGTSKGPLYNAFGRFQRDMEPKVKALGEVQAKLDAAGLKLDSLDQQVKEAESSLAPLEDRRKTLNEEIEPLETKVAEKSELLEHAGELEKLGFDTEKLRQLREALTEIGVKSGLTGKEAVAKFFDDLKDYDAKTGFEREIQRLETITETKRLEAGKWQAEADSLSRCHKDLSEAITAVKSLIKHGVNIEQIVSWNGIVNKLGGPEELEKELSDYKTMSELLNARKEEAKAYGLRLVKAQSQVETLEKERAKIEAQIDALKEAGIKQIKAMVARELEEIQAVGGEVRAQFSSRFAQYDELLEGISQAAQKLERLKQELQKYEALKETLASHAVASEAEK